MFIIDAVNEFVSSHSIFFVPAWRNAKFIEGTTKLVRKAKQLGVEGVNVFALSEPQITNQSVTDSDGRRKVVQFPMHYYAVSGLMPRVNGKYTFAAKCAFTPNGALVTGPKEMSDLVPAKFREGNNICNHCNKARSRKLTYVLRNDETGEFFQVGSTCIVDFFGKTGVKELLWAAEDWRSAFEQIGDGGSDGGGGYGGGYLDQITLTGFMTAVLFVLSRDHGIFKPAAFCESSTSTQAQGVLAILRKNNKDRDDLKLEIEVAKFYEAAQSLVAEARTKLTELEDCSGYEHNLKMCVLSDVVIGNTYGILASLPKYLHGSVKPVKMPTAVSEYVGVVGAKVQIEVTFTKAASYDSAYGTVYVYTFTDANGNAFKWKTGAGLDTDPEIGDKLVLTATVKAHEEYRGIKETVIIRVKRVQAKAA